LERRRAVMRMLNWFTNSKEKTFSLINIMITFHGASSVIIVFSVLMISSNLQALPQGVQINGGQANLNQNINTLNIHQLSPLISINYDSFNIATGETVNFIQPNEISIALNRVTGNNATEIFGSLNANGQVFLINPNGILFAPGSQINVGGLFASTLNILDEDFFNQQLNFNSASSATSIINYADVQGRYIAFVSPHIENHGELIADNISLHAADSVFVSFSPAIHIETQTDSYEAVIENHGLIRADDGYVALTTAAHNALMGTAINNQGVIEARGVVKQSGRVFLTAENQGDIINSGEINVSAINENINGGDVFIDAQRVAQSGVIHADGMGYGNGGNLLLSADQVVVLGEKSFSTANAGANGNGGEVIAFSPDTALFRQGGNIETRGGFESGNGGYVDVSGWQHVEVDGLVDTSAINGDNGLFLIDPYNITIGGAADAFLDTADIPWRPTNSGSVISVATLLSNLALGDVSIITTPNPDVAGEAGIISVSAAIDLDGINAGQTLTLTADADILVNASISDQTGAVDNNTNIVMTASGAINMTSAGFEINAGAGTINLTSSSNANITGISTSNTSSSAISITANTITDAGNINTDLSAPNGSVSLLTTGDVGQAVDFIDTDVAQLTFNMSGSGNAFVSELNDIRLTSVTGVNNLDLTVNGTLVIPDSGLSVSGNLNFQVQDITDSDREISLSAQDLMLDISAAAGSTIINSNIDRLDGLFASAAGSNNLTIIETNGLALLHLGTGDTNALTNTDGNMSIQVQSGNLILNDRLLATDASNDGIRSGMIDLRVDAGDILIGNNGGNAQIESNNIVDNDVAGGLDGNQVSVRISNPDTADINSNTVLGDGIGADVLIEVIGGDLIIDNHSEVVLTTGNSRDVTLNSDVTVNVYNNVTDALDGSQDVQALTLNNAQINVRTARSFVASAGSILAPVVPPVTPPVTPPVVPIVVDEVDLLSDIEAVINDSVTDSDQDVSPRTTNNTSAIFQQVFTACENATEADRERLCGVEYLIKDFLNSLLIGGQLPQ
jgi:filamentous hemagglutinin family protein